MSATDPATNGWSSKANMPAEGAWGRGRDGTPHRRAGGLRPRDQPVGQQGPLTTRPPLLSYVGDTYDMAATGGGSGNPVVFSSLTPAVCTAGPSANNASAVDLVGVGTCTVAADQAGNATYAPAPQVTQSFTVRQETTQ